MANGLQDFLGAPNPFDVQPAEPAMEPGPLAYDPMNTGQGSMGMGMGAAAKVKIPEFILRMSKNSNESF